MCLFLTSEVLIYRSTLRYDTYEYVNHNTLIRVSIIVYNIYYFLLYLVNVIIC